MARIQTGALISGISGKIGGSVFQGSQSGIIMRNQSQTINRRTEKQQMNKIGIVSIQQSWQALTAAQIAVWNAYALFLNKKQKNNVGKNISGQQLFIQQNQIRWSITSFHNSLAPVIILDPVIQLDPIATSILAVSNTAGVLDFTTSSGISAGSWIQLKMSRPLLASQESSYNKKNIIPFAFGAGGASWNITTAYTSIYGRVPSVGEYVNTELTWGIDTTNGNSPSVKQRIIVTS